MRVAAVGKVLSLVEVLVPVRAVTGVATAVTVAGVVGDVLYVDGVVRLVVVSVRDDLVGGLGVFLLQAVGDEEDSGEDESDLGGGEGLERDELHDEELAEQQFGSEKTDDTSEGTASLLLTTTCRGNNVQCRQFLTYNKIR